MSTTQPPQTPTLPPAVIMEVPSDNPWQSFAQLIIHSITETWFAAAANRYASVAFELAL